MPELRLSELYTSIQGEGPNVGQPTQFVRFAGCNLRCPGWPCDTPHAIDPKIWREEAERLDFETLNDRLAEWPRSITLTGGEPLTQPSDELKNFVELSVLDYEIDIFTNGTRPFPGWLVDPNNDITIIMDWKLPGSGEPFAQSNLFVAPETQSTRLENAGALRESDAIKFTVKDIRDLDVARDTYYKLGDNLDCQAQVYVGGVWDAIDDQLIVEYITSHELDWKLNVQLHKYVWPAEARGV